MWHIDIDMKYLVKPVCSFFFNQKQREREETDRERERGQEHDQHNSGQTQDAKIHGVGQEFSTKLQKWGLEKVHVIPQKNVPGDLAVVLVAFPVSM